MTVPILPFREPPSQCGYRATLFSFSRRGRLVNLHAHEFYEMMYVQEGGCVHEINGSAQEIACGDLLFIRPADVHGLVKRADRKGPMVFVNIEIAAGAWREFSAGAGMSGEARGWDRAPMPPAARIGLSQRSSCARVFQRALDSYFRAPRRIDLYRFLSGAVDFLQPVEDAAEEMLRRMPPWLAEICRDMNEPQNLQAGLPRMREMSPVSFSHLARSLRAHTGQSPTRFINSLRARYAAVLLTTTSNQISDIALESGFENLSYFYRVFQEYYARAPHQYRLEARGGVE